MPFQQPPLPFRHGRHETVPLRGTVDVSLRKHHAAYFKNLNGLVEGKPEANCRFARWSSKRTGPVFNNAAQAWNHSFYWDCMKPKGGGNPAGDLAAAISATSAVSITSKKPCPKPP